MEKVQIGKGGRKGFQLMFLDRSELGDQPQKLFFWKENRFLRPGHLVGRLSGSLCQCFCSYVHLILPSGAILLVFCSDESWKALVLWREMDENRLRKRRPLRRH